MFKPFMVLVAAAIALPAYGQSVEPGGSVHVNRTSNGRTVRLRSGQRLVVSLQNLGSTRWSLTGLPANLSLSGVDRIDNAPPPNPPRPENIIVGAGVTVEYWFEGERAGAGALTFELRSIGGRHCYEALRV